MGSGVNLTRQDYKLWAVLSYVDNFAMATINHENFESKSVFPYYVLCKIIVKDIYIAVEDIH